MSGNIYIGKNAISTEKQPIEGDYVEIDGQRMYRIANYDKMRPFFITLVSHSDHWMFISSNGGLTAGRKNQDEALFPYYTDDKLADLSESSGSKTLIKAFKDEKIFLWEPFSDMHKGAYTIRRNLYKNKTGNALLFEEINDDLQLTYRYSWKFSEKYGFIKSAELINNNDFEIQTEILDGLQNILPWGVESNFQAQKSNLINAYKKSELHVDTGIGIFRLSAKIVDRAEPSEALKATTVWQTGLNNCKTLLSTRQLELFIKNDALDTESEIKADPGAYFTVAQKIIEPGSDAKWYFIADVNQDHADVVSLIQSVKGAAQIDKELRADIEHGTATLMELVGKADGIQQTGDELMTGRHYANVMFNIMRGGIFDQDYTVFKSDVIDYIQSVNRTIFHSEQSFFNNLPEKLTYQELLSRAVQTEDLDVIRICTEYLPLSFSRRHGDPSRPWNKFSIHTKKEDGTKNRNYEGNWRDIFQNWEALTYAYPEYAESMISKFLNASTIDGYNPYRITREGIDWEVTDPDDPWSFIGYWGDHQIIYLQKLLEVSQKHHPEIIHSMLNKKRFVYANVPYRIKSYENIVANPSDTIQFDAEVHNKSIAAYNEIGADGKLSYDAEGQIIRATFTEKILVSLLAKLSNFIPEAGIWLNTQRPEWNDANNALVGNGTSMVTLYYMRRFVNHIVQLFSTSQLESFELHKPVKQLFESISNCFQDNIGLLQESISDADRKRVTDQLGQAGSAYRNQAYTGFNSEYADLDKTDLVQFLEIVLQYLDHSIAANKRSDGLYHAYNLITYTSSGITISYLYEMLEGQVAVLSSGMLSAKESLSVLDALKASAMYREDQYSYMLYPDRNLPSFLEMNQIPADALKKSVLAHVLIENGNHDLIVEDAEGTFHFNGTFHNGGDVKRTLDHLRSIGFEKYVDQDEKFFLQLFEDMFNHKAFTGRSGTFFGYEGLGSIYWHMVSKLLLSAQECIWQAIDSGANGEIIGRLIDHYYEIRAGIGINKSPELYGSFPTDPYSHTPAHKGAQQPGMTGQVKEDVLNRWAELGVRISNGCIAFIPEFLHPDEFLNSSATFTYYDLDDTWKKMELESGQLAFTYGQVPVVYTKSDKRPFAEVELENETISLKTTMLTKELSESIFQRRQLIKKIIIYLN